MNINRDDEGLLSVLARPGSGNGEYVRGVDIRVLGPVDVRVDGASVQLGGPKQRGLLALLIAAAPRVVSADALIGGLWGEEPTSGARSTLQTYISNLRHVLGGHLIHDRGGYRLDVEPRSVDAVRFEKTLDESRSRLTTDPAAAAGSLRQALSLWRGRPYADLIDVPGLEPEARRLEELRLEAVELRIDSDLASGLHGTLVAELEALAEEHPTREHFRAQHMLALYRSGRQAEALRGYRRTESFLADELGVEPSRELQELELKILQQDESLLAGTGRAITQRLAFLVTDIEDSTGLWDRHPKDMAGALATHDRVLREAIEADGGRVFKHTGDGLMAVFPDVVAAVRAAERALRTLASSEWRVVDELKVRMGVDVGEAETRGDDFFGPPLNRATRLCAIGHGGQVLVSSSAQAELSAAAPTGLQIRHLGEVRLRGLTTPEQVAQLVFVGLQADFPDFRRDAESELDQRLEVLSVPGYEVRDRIGEGAFGVVWRAYQPSVGREVAIKMIRPELASQPSFVRRFEAEARTIARLAHPHIVPLIDFWRDSHSAYLVLGLLQGGSLTRAMAAGSIDRSMARKILSQVGNALDHAHSQEMLHGDLKPANVLLDGAGNAYLSDFGLTAQLLYPEMVSSCSTDPAYRAPEETETGPSPAGDRYALGVMAREVLDGDSDLDAVIARATAPRPDDRFESCAAFIADLDRVMGIQTEVAAVVSRNPYKGLRAFDEGDAADFFGRDELIAALVAAVERHRFVTVVGPSGSGKSSAVQAGLLPALAKGAIGGSKQWFRALLNPGSHPLDSLADALQSVASEPIDLHQPLAAGDLTAAAELLLGDAEGDLLIVVDQFEELFTLVDDPQHRRDFIDLLVDTVETEHTRVRVVTTLRADFYHRPLVHDRIDRLVRDGLVTVLRPSREELIEIISRPAQAVGLRWEPGLPHRIAQDVADQPGTLPLLEFALTELVERRHADLLTASDYERIGGVTGALARRTEAVFGSLTSSQQRAVRQLMPRLVTVDEDTEATRRRVRRSELESLPIERADLDAVLAAFTAERLLVADRDPVTRGPTVEVAHEAILSEWPRLAAWIEEHREALILGRRFRAALADWETANRHPDYLLTGSRLAPFLGWAETSSFTTDERTFYEASVEKGEAEHRVRARRRRVLTGILASATAVAILLASVALTQSRRAAEEAERALAAEQDAEADAARAIQAEQDAEADAARALQAEQLARSRELAASAINVLDRDPELSVLLALAATDLAEPPFESVSALHQAVQSHRTLRAVQWPTAWRHLGGTLGSIDPKGRYVAVSGLGHKAAVWDLDRDSDEPIWSFELPWPDYAKIVPRFTADGSRVVATVAWFNPEEEPADWPEPPPEAGVYVLDVETGDVIQHLRGPQCPFTDLAQSSRFLDLTQPIAAVAPSGEDCSPFDSDLWLVNMASGEMRLAYQGLPTAPYGTPMSLSNDGRLLSFTLRANESTKVVDLNSGEEVFDVPGGVNARLSGDGYRLLASTQGIVSLWNVDTGEQLWEFASSASVFDHWFSEDEGLVYGGAINGSIRVLDAHTGELIHEIRRSGGPSWGISMSADRTRIASFSSDRTVRVWDVAARGGSEIIGFDLPGLPVLQSGHVVGDHLAILVYPESVFVEPGTAVLLDIESGETEWTFDGYAGQMVRISPDGTRLAGQPSPSPGILLPVHIRDIESGQVLSELEGLCSWNLNELAPGPDCVGSAETLGELWWLDFSPNGSMLAVSGVEGAAGVWDVETGRRLAELDAPFSSLWFSPESDLLLLDSDEGLRVMETEGWSEVTRLPIVNCCSDLAYMPDGARLLGLAGAPEPIVGIDTTTWEYLDDPYPIDGPDSRDVSVSRDGSMIATAGSDGSVRIWDVETGKALQAIPIGLPEGRKSVTIAQFLDNRHIFVVAGEGSAMIVTTDTAELIDLARSRLTRSFTDQECSTYRIDPCPALEEIRRP